MSAEDNQYVEQQPGGEGLRSRRDLLKTAGVVAGVAVAAKLASPDAASAAHGNDLVVGVNNTEELGFVTKLSTSPGTAGAAGAAAFDVAAPNFDYGLKGDGGDYGVWGTGPGGVVGTGTVGGTFRGSAAAINLVPQPGAGAPTGESLRGDLAVDSTGVLFLCINGGTAQTASWIRVSHGGNRYLSSPQRAYDSRPPSTDGKLRPGAGDLSTPRVLQIGGLFGVPSNAVGVFGNLAVTQGDAGSFATIWPSGAWPGTANINFNANQDLSNGFNVGLGPGGTVSVAAFAPVHVVVDVAGYIL